jgi:arylmalonate decarboxylase
MERHDARLKYIEDKTGISASSSLTGVLDATRHLGIGNIALANRFSNELNDRLSGFFVRAGVWVEGYHGYAGPRRTHGDIKSVSGAVHMEDAYQRGRKAFEAFPQADGLYMGGGAASLTPVVVRLEQEFGKPVIGHQDAMVWDILKQVNYWKPIPGCGRLLTAG